MSFYSMDECADCKRCGRSFEKVTWNNEYCPDCKRLHRNERLRKNYRIKHGGVIRENNSHNWSTSKRFEYYMERTWQTALCPVCGAHMSADPCSSGDPNRRQYQPEGVKTWQIWNDRDVKQYLAHSKESDK